MPTEKNWFNFLFINFIFLINILSLYHLSFVKQIDKNWSYLFNNVNPEVYDWDKDSS